MNAMGIKPKLLCAILLPAFLAVACEDSTTEPAEPLTMQETEALYVGLQHVASDTMPDIISMTPNGGVIACPLGGQAGIVFDFSEETVADTARLITNVTLNPDGCVLSSEGSEFTLDGNPDVRLEVNVAIVGSTFEFLVDGLMTGGVDWQLEDRSGTCLIDLVFGLDATDPTKATVSGTMCDHEVEFDATALVSQGGGG